VTGVDLAATELGGGDVRQCSQRGSASKFLE
jgi:hypothetical protein